MDLIRPDRSTASVFGPDSQVGSLAAKRLIGYLPGETPFFPGERSVGVVARLVHLGEV